MEKIIKERAKKYGLPVGLIKAIIKTESTNNQYAMRCEPEYKWTFNIDEFSGPLQTWATEEIAQKTSWGHMQVMGAVARELGFKGTFLSELTNPEIGIEYGCRHLAHLKKRFSMTDCLSVFCDRKIAAYNAGAPRMKPDGTYRNQEYVDRVLNNWK